MKKYLLLMNLFVLIINLAKAQSHVESVSFWGRPYAMKCEAQVDNSIKVSILDGKTDTIMKTFSVWTNDMEVFATVFKDNFLDSTGPNKADSASVLAYGRKLFVNYLTSLQNTIPNAGIFKLQDSVVIHYQEKAKSKLKESTTVQKYKVLRLQAEINDGYLENIVIYLSSNDTAPDKKKIIRFILPYPVGMSSVDNFRKYYSDRLFELKSKPYRKENKYYLLLSELIDYDYYLGVKRRDYSPKDTSLDIIGGTSIILHKEETKKLFEAHIFTDFEGLKESNPNGLIQTEISKRINIKTIQRSSPEFLYGFVGSYGAFQYIAPSVTISKIEQHNKQLDLSDLDSVRLNPGATDTSLFSKNYHRYANALALYQYQWFSAGIDLNLFYINNHQDKFNIYLNAGIRLGVTDVTDSLTKVASAGITKTGFVNQYQVSAFQLYPEIRVNYFPEERFNLSISHKFVYFKPLSPAVQLASYDKNNSSKVYPKSDSWLNISELLMTIQVNPNSKLFGKIRFNWEASNPKNNFSQIQVGYSTYILGNK